MTRFLICIFFVSRLFGGLLAQSSQPCSGQPAVAVLHANALRLYVNSVGQSGGAATLTPVVHYDGSTQASAGFYMAGLWIAGLDPTQNIRLAESAYGLLWQDYTPGPTTAGASGCQQWNRVWSVSRAEIEAHRQDWLADGHIDQPLDAVFAWPGSGNPYFESMNGFPLPSGTETYAPFYDNDGDGLYNPFNGDYPHPEGVAPGRIVGAMLWGVFNSGQSNVSLEVQSTLWAFGCDDDNALNDTYFQSLRVINRDGFQLDSLHLGVWQDLNIGNAIDDNIGTNPALNTVFAYNADDNDEDFLGNPGYGPNPGIIALSFLNRPLFKSMYIANPSFNNYPLAMIDPSADVENYRYLNGYWRDGTTLTASGSGYNPNDPQAPEADYFFYGNPLVPGEWAMNQLNLPYAGFRTITSANLGNLAPGQSAALDMAFSYHRGEGLDNLQNIAFGLDRIAQIKQSWDSGFEDACLFASCTDDCVWPGDINRDGIVNQCDILPFGSGWAATGPSRDGFVNWAPQTAAGWGQVAGLGYDLKHLDANGNGEVEQYDAQVIRDFYGNVTPWWVADADEYPVGNDFNIKLSPNNFDTTNVLVGQVCFVAVRFDSLKTVRGAAFEMELDSAYWEIVTSGFAQEQGVILVNKSVPTGLAGGRVRIDSQQAFNDGGWATMKIKAKSIPPTQSNTTYIRLKNIKGIAPDGSEVALGAYPQKFVFAGGSSAAGAPAGTEAWRVSPNPAADVLRIETPGEQLQEVVFYDLAGRVLGRTRLSGSEQATVDTARLQRGISFVLIQTFGNARFVKVILD